MLPCEPHRDRLLDHLYGLLDPTEAAEFDAHLAGCPDCTTARADAGRMQGLFARAARSAFPDVSFVPPTEKAVPSELNHRPQPAEPVRASVQSAWVKWAVAASLVLTVAAVGGPATRDTIGFLFYKPAVDRTLVEVEKADTARKQRDEELKNAKAVADRRKTEAQEKYAKLVEEWLKREEQAIAAAAAQPFVVDVRGPSTALAGAPNDYTIEVKDKAAPARPKAVDLQAQVRDADGKVLFDRKFPATAKTALKLPCGMWDGVKPGTELVLSVTATDPANGALARVTEQVRLLEPVFTTFLTTDKPMYRPGEAVYFRSLTLDRTRFLPPDRDLNLMFVLHGPDGNPIPGLKVVGLAKPAAGPAPRPILGPDGRPVHGVGTGAFALPETAHGGEYKLVVTELPPNAFDAVAGSKVLAERKIIVNRYTPDRLEKKLEFDARTYGPGDTVQAKFELKDQSKPVAGADLQYAVQVIDRPGAQPVILAPDVAPPKTDAAGAASVRFTLPTGELKSVSLAINVTSKGVRETLVREVPLAARTLDVEFFPEGGDLIAGVENRVYFRATNRTDGKPADVTGVLTDGVRTISDVKTLTDPDHPGVNQGLGLFAFTPEPGKRYAVKLDRPLGVEQPPAFAFGAVVGAGAATPLTGHPLPKAKAAGVMLTVPDGVTGTGDPLRVRLASAGAKRTLLIGAYTRGRPIAHTRATVEPGKPVEVALDFAGSKLGGVTRVTVFEEPAGEGPGRDDLKPVAERLVYRRPGEVLKIGFTPKADGKPHPGAFLPGSPVELAVTTYDEAGRPKPAILWAAVVNQSVLAMADEKTARLLPTHFLLGGEVRNPDELEHADFLLTDHPKAAAGLDLLLGTQGWRRFAEQSPEFRQRAPAGDIDRLLLAMGNPGRPVPVGWRDGVRKVFDEYWPKYEAAALELERAERDQTTGEAVKPARDNFNQAEIEYTQRMTSFGTAASDISVFDKGMDERKDWLPATCIFLVGLAALLLAARFLRPAGAPERKPLTVGAIGFLAVGVFVLLATGVSQLGGDRWKAVAVSAPKPTNPYLRGMPATAVVDDVPSPPRVKKDNREGPDRANPKKPKDPPAVVIVQDPRAGGRDVIVPVADEPKRKLPAVPQPGMPASRARLNDELDALVAKAAAGDARARAGFARTQIKNLAPQASGLIAREYAHARPDLRTNAPRTDFAETLLWQPVLVTAEGGAATVKFDLSDAINGYQVLIAGHTLDGRLGAVTGTIEVRKPLVVEPKLPQEIGSADKLDVPIVVTNGTAGARTAAIELTLTGLAVEGGGDKLSAAVPANGGARKLVRLVPDRPEGLLTLKVAADADGLTDAVERKLTVVPDGYPAQGGASDTLEKQYRTTLALPPQWAKGTMKAAVTVYPNTLADLQGGLDGLLREPNGCFEQSSTANYPNVLITGYFNDGGRGDPEVSRRARDLMDRGYAKLTAFECPKTGAAKVGYEWFGAADRPHEALTAYGLMQFTDMSKVYPVDPAMLRRTKQYLIDSRDGNGGFRRSAAAVDQFGRAPDHITNAYIAWAITEADRGAADQADLTKELDTLFKLATEHDGKAARDPYFLALVANALLNRNRQADGQALLKTVVGLQAADGSVPGATTSITRSGGRALVIETTALTVLGWLKANRPDVFAVNVASAMKWVLAQRDPGGAFGSTQSTILALKALVEYARANRRPAESGELRVTVGGRPLGAKAFTTESVGPIVVEVPEDALKPGDNEVRVETTAKQSYPLSVAWACRTRQPAAAPDCAVKLVAKLAKTEVVEGDVVRLDLTVENRKADPQGMVIAVVGIPAGLKLSEDMKQLTTLTARPADGSEPKVAHWETRGRELVLYWRGLTANQAVSVGLDLIADVPGEYRGPAGRAYLYYDADQKCWVPPLDVKVRAK